MVEHYLEGLSSSREVTDEERKKIRKAISNLQGLLSFPFTALELAADIDEEAVSDVFVRINSKGTPQEVLHSDRPFIDGTHSESDSGIYQAKVSMIPSTEERGQVQLSIRP